MLDTATPRICELNLVPKVDKASKDLVKRTKKSYASS